MSAPSAQEPAEPPRRRASGRRTGAIALAAIATISAVALALTFAFVSYVRTTECPSYHYGDPGHFGMTVTRGQTNWTVEVTSGQRGLHPNTTYVQIIGPSHDILLGRTPWSALTASDWSAYHVLYQDSRPEVPLVCEGDRLIVDTGTFPSGSSLWVMSEAGMIGWTTLF